MGKKIILGVGFLVLFFFAAGCAGRVELKKPVKAAPPEAMPEVTVKEVKPVPEPTEGLATKEDLAKALKGEGIPVATLEGVTREPATAEEKAVFKTIYFDFDKSDIRSDARLALEKVADYLKKNPKVKIVIEGNCDELGTEEYNMALGERRALSARRYLVSLGIAPERMGTVSYGEDRPIDPAHNETAWVLNRNGQFKIME
ncbi:MAG: peptidoglycan-associated lipoprotein Pal [Candidatus Omnitrophota bacterium]|nr:peptidoglycan-associated lipoprotein Pal [Candidatus Omnitrophota bacterium]